MSYVAQHNQTQCLLAEQRQGNDEADQPSEPSASQPDDPNVSNVIEGPQVEARVVRENEG